VSHRVAHFLFIGGVAFWLDAATYFLTGYLFVLVIGGSVPLIQKLAGFMVGVFTTYLYNSRITFKANQDAKRFFRYLGSQLFGMLINLGIFFVVHQFFSALLALAVATLLATVVNFLGARFVLRH
jgi:putative flippase GtrA